MSNRTVHRVASYTVIPGEQDHRIEYVCGVTEIANIEVKQASIRTVTCPGCRAFIEAHTCKECGHMETAGYGYEKFIKVHGLCRDCFIKSKGLVKVGNHYVPWNYTNWVDSDKVRDEKDFEDVNSSLPEISWCPEHGKFKITFTGADGGGYDVETFTWYFDSIEDIINEMCDFKKDTE